MAGGTMKKKDRISEREYQGRLESLLKSAFNTQLQPLRTLETATKKRRALKKKAAKNSQKPGNPLDAQARALNDSDTFEARWRERVDMR
jgi:hypothetical protein